jgi:hypothetical protein
MDRMPSAFATPALLLLVDLLLDDHTEVDRELGLAHADHIASKQTRLTQTCRHPGFPTHVHQLAEVPGAPFMTLPMPMRVRVRVPAPLLLLHVNLMHHRPTAHPPRRCLPVRQARRRASTPVGLVAAVLELPSASAEMRSLRRCMVGRTRP